MEPVKNSNTQTHPDKIDLFSYLESPDSAAMKQISVHLAGCPQCRDIAGKNQAILQELKSSPLLKEDDLSGWHPNEQILADYVEERLPENEKERVRSHTLECGYCLKCVRHYIANRSELEKRLEKEVFSPAAGREEDKFAEFFQRKIQAIMDIFSRRVPVWTGAPAFALAGCLFFVFFQSPDRASKDIIVTFQVSPFITVSDLKKTGPGIGFFSQAPQEMVNFSGLTFTGIKDDLHEISWQKVAGAETYRITLFLRSEDGEIKIGEKRVKEPKAVMDLSSLGAGKEYRWKLSGTMGDGRSFSGQGGLALGRGRF